MIFRIYYKIYLKNLNVSNSRKNFKSTDKGKEFAIFLGARCSCIWNSSECVGLFWINQCHHHQWNQSMVAAILKIEQKPDCVKWTKVTNISITLFCMKWFLTLPFGKTCIFFFCFIRHLVYLLRLALGCSINFFAS